MTTEKSEIYHLDLGIIDITEDQMAVIMEKVEELVASMGGTCAGGFSPMNFPDDDEVTIEDLKEDVKITPPDVHDAFDNVEGNDV
jgi:hypothetical protein